MIVMSDLNYDHQITIRSVGAAKGAFDRVVSDLRSRAKLRFRGRKITREALANALFLWMADRDPAKLEEALTPYVERFETLIADSGGEAPVISDDELPPAQPARAHGFWPGGEAQTMTESLRRELRDAAKPKKAPPGRVAKTEVVPDPKAKKGKTG